MATRSLAMDGFPSTKLPWAPLLPIQIKLSDHTDILLSSALQIRGSAHEFSLGRIAIKLRGNKSLKAFTPHTVVPRLFVSKWEEYGRGSGLQDHLSLRWRQTRSPWWRPRATGRQRSACVVVLSARPTRRVHLPVTPQRHRKRHNLPIPGKPTGKGRWGQSVEGFL